ncbi:MAG: hypothetical protein AVDCRST_MAG87-3348, partial [uncultured Thermomicrobiales bacterium]
EKGLDEVHDDITHRVAPSVVFPVLGGYSVVKVREGEQPESDQGKRPGRLFTATTLMPLHGR